MDDQHPGRLQERASVIEQRNYRRALALGRVFLARWRADRGRWDGLAARVAKSTRWRDRHVWALPHLAQIDDPELETIRIDAAGQWLLTQARHAGLDTADWFTAAARLGAAEADLFIPRCLRADGWELVDGRWRARPDGDVHEMMRPEWPSREGTRVVHVVDDDG